MLPKLEIHFGDAVLRIPQTKRVNLIMCAYGAHTLKENLLSCYKSRVRDVLKEQGIIRSYDADMQVLAAYIGRKLYEEGPYAVLGRVMQWRYSLDKEDLCHYASEICYANVNRIGEIQEARSW